MSDDSVFLRAQLNRLLGALGSNDAASVGGVFGDWETLVGEHVARHVTPVKLTDGVLVVEVSEPAWATEVRFLERTLCTTLSTVTTTPVTSIEVRVRRR
jgi:predicted nucleic acid-binding Zn ribbon protein